MGVTQLVIATFQSAATRHSEIHKRWIRLSVLLGGQLPKSLLAEFILRAGELDMVLRCMEDERAVTAPSEQPSDADIWAGGLLSGLSRTWVGELYEVFRILISKERGFDKNDPNLGPIHRDLELLRIPLEKHEIAKDNYLKDKGPLGMRAVPAKGDKTDLSSYDRLDPLKSHIMPSEFTERGSICWLALDLVAQKERRIERRDLSDRILALVSVPPADPVKAEEGQRAGATGACDKG